MSDSPALSRAPRWTDAELAYLAGILDGEGTFSLYPHHGSRFDCNVIVGNTDLRMISWLKTHFGGTRHFEQRTPPHKNMWRWISHSPSLTELLEAVVPFLVVKRDRAELLLAYRATLAERAPKSRRWAGMSNSTHPTTNIVKQQRADILQQLRVLNRKGVAS